MTESDTIHFHHNSTFYITVLLKSFNRLDGSTLKPSGPFHDESIPNLSDLGRGTQQAGSIYEPRHTVHDTGTANWPSERFFHNSPVTALEIRCVGFDVFSYSRCSIRSRKPIVAWTVVTVRQSIPQLVHKLGQVDQPPGPVYAENTDGR
jgi:hypothetical protein